MWISVNYFVLLVSCYTTNYLQSCIKLIQAEVRVLWQFNRVAVYSLLNWSMKRWRLVVSGLELYSKCNLYLQQWNSIDCRYKTVYDKQWVISIHIAASIVVWLFFILIHVPGMYWTGEFLVYSVRGFEMLQMLWYLSLSSDMIGFTGTSGL
jgi:hypothetical protein